MTITSSIFNRYGDRFFNHRLFNCYLITGFILLPVVAYADDYYFDPALFQGSAFGQDLGRFNQQNNDILVGDHLLDIYVNDNLIANKENVYFDKMSEDKSVPCLSLEMIKKTQIRFKDEDKSRDQSQHCILVDQLNDDIHWDVEQSKLRLNLYIPQKDLLQNPRGYIPVSEWDEGDTALFLRHNTNYSHTQNSGQDYDYLWSNLSSGINLGLWQIRHQGNFRYSNSNYGGSKSHYNVVRTWIQRPIAEIGGTLMLGDTYTNSNLLGGLSFRGFRFNSDQRMKPQSKRGYAPEVRGIAASSARVVIRQNSKIIYETSVPPGEFVINDLYNTAMQGDLNVEVIESNGQTSYFTVPYTSTPDSVRVGNLNYELALGKVNQFNDVHNSFVEGTFQYGLTNYLTTNFGSRFSQDYQAALVGVVFSSSIGAFGLNTTWSRADLGNQGRETGWRWEGNYSNSFSNGTNIVLSAYRYSTAGFRDFQDVLGVLRQQKNGIYYDSATLRQRNRLSMTVSQPLSDWGSLYLTGSTADYYDNKSRINQLQLGYSNSYKRISYNISVARQQIILKNSDSYSSQERRSENTISITVSIPLDWPGRSSLSFDANKSADTKSGSVKIIGSAGKQSDFSYSLYAGLDKTKGESSSANWGANIQQNTSVGAFRGAISQGQNYKQYNLGASGALVLHGGGLTLGPYVSDTFALVHADGAKGAIIKNGQGATIDRFGYAIMPSLTPYRYNSIVLDTSDMADNIELKGGSDRVVPYFGAMLKVNFETISGKPVLINLSLADQQNSIPMGAEVFDENKQSIGMVGQGGQIYARLNNSSGVLNVVWGDNTYQKCQVHYQLSDISDDFITTLDLPCTQESL